MRSLFQIHATLKSHHRTEAAVLGHTLIRAAAALPQVVHQVVDETFRRTLTGVEMLKTNLAAAARAVASLIVGINRLEHVTDGMAAQGQVIYAYVNMFTSLLSVLEKASVGEAEKAALVEAATAVAKKAATSKTKGKAQQPRVLNLKDVPTLNAVTRFLCGILELLD